VITQANFLIMHGDGSPARRRLGAMITGIFVLLGALAQWHAEYRQHRMSPPRLPSRSALG